MSEPRLAEVPEWAAAGPLAGLYADIRSVLGLPMVNLVYRHLATRPGLLERCWTALRPNLASSAAAAAATELGALAALGGPQVSLVAGLPEETVRLARATAGACDESVPDGPERRLGRSSVLVGERVGQRQQSP